jgi:hypothetical protein
MPSHIVYSHAYQTEVDRGDLVPENFDYYFLCEGDSWMDRSSLSQMSLPWALGEVFKGRKGNRALFINLSRFGHTLRHIGDCLNDDFHQWVNTQGMPFRFDALLFSAGGNDFIDAAQKPPPGRGILRDMRNAAGGFTAEDCFDPDAVGKLVAGYLDPNFHKLHATVRGSRNSDMPILLNCYTMPIAGLGESDGKKTWLARAYRKNGIPEALWPEVTERLFIEVEAAVVGWTRDERHDGVFAVPTTSVQLDRSEWVNEIHPGPKGWALLAQVWQQALDKRL